MKKTLLLIGSGILLLGGCRVYEDDRASKRIAGIAERNNEDREKARAHGDKIRQRVWDATPERTDRINGYLARRAEEPTRKLERQRARIADLRDDARNFSSDRNHSITDIGADMTVSGTVAEVRGDTVKVLTDDGQTVTLKAAVNSHVVADNREIPAPILPEGFPVTASYGSVDGENYYYAIEAITEDQ